MGYFEFLKSSNIFLSVREFVNQIFPYVLENLLGLSLENDPILVFVVVSILTSILLLLFVPVPFVTFSTILFVEPVISVPSLLVGIVVSSYASALIGYRGIINLKYSKVEKLRAKFEDFLNRNSKLEKFASISFIAVLRHFPVAPYSIVNIALGQFGIRPIIVATGSLLGLIPNVVLLALGKNLIF